jgi:hypothetical protein
MFVLLSMLCNRYLDGKVVLLSMLCNRYFDGKVVLLFMLCNYLCYVIGI